MSVDVNFQPVEDHILRATDGAIREAMLQIEREVVLEIERQKLEVSGFLKQSITSEVVDNVATIGTNMKYAAAVHEGSKPHWAPIDPLRVWVHMKFGLRGKEVEKTARAVQVSIAKKGTKPHPFFTNAFERWQNKLPRFIADAMKKRLPA